MNTIELGSDHAGYELKVWLQKMLSEMEINVNDHGTFSNESADYPDYAHATAKAVLDSNNKGILICGSANGVCMTANKYAGIRAALCWNNDVAELARLHNDANMLCLPARFITQEEALSMVKVFIATAFEGGRHATRVNKINC
jgi:ribose 5-phosphate isomerase B